MKKQPNSKVCAFIDANQKCAFVILIGGDNLLDEAKPIFKNYLLPHLDSDVFIPVRVGSAQTKFIKATLKNKIEEYVSCCESKLVIITVQDTLFLYYLDLIINFQKAKDFQREDFLKSFPDEKEYLESIPLIKDWYKFAIWDSGLDTLRRQFAMRELIWDNSLTREMDDIGLKCKSMNESLDWKKELRFSPTLEIAETIVRNGMKIANSPANCKEFSKVATLITSHPLTDRWCLHCIAESLKSYLSEENANLELEFYNIQEMDEHMKTLVDFCYANKKTFFDLL
ncbi:MAG: hypothetical protein EBU90_01430 [Proteobacteria bacterium]|nr:hypothetical protein [Pseudomonadota bacterium]